MHRTSDKYIPGDRLVLCDECGFGYRFSDMKKGISLNQKNYNVCPTCFDEFHPRDRKFKPRKQGKLPEVK